MFHRHKTYTLFCFVLLSLLLATSGYPAGTPAGEAITNLGKVDAAIMDEKVDLSSNITSTIVAEVIDLSIEWLDTSNVLVQPGTINQVLTYKLTNTGNGTEDFVISVDNTSTTDQFDPFNSQIFLDSNSDGSYQAGADTLYNSTTNRPILAADEEINLFVLSSIPSSASRFDIGISVLNAEAATGSGAPGDTFPPQSTGEPIAILGDSGGAASAQGIYVIDQPVVTLDKSYRINDPNGGSEPITGATITYAILVTVSDLSTANDLIISDGIPAGTTYVPGSMRLTDTTTISLTDINDADAGEYKESPPASGNYEVQFSLGELTNTTKTVTFQVTID